jgi:hypothetical protein
MWSPRLSAAAALALCIGFVPSAAEAQLGGIVKKAKDRVVPGQQQSTDEAARLPGPTLTNDVVTRLLRSLTAEKRARDQAERERERRRVADSVAAAERQRPDRYTTREECQVVKLKADTAYPGWNRLLTEASAAAERNDIAKTSEISQRMAVIQVGMQERAEAACANVPPASSMPAPAPQPTPQEQAVQESPDSLEITGAGAGGFSATEYGQLKELVWTYLNYPQKAGLAANEKRAVDGKRKELKDGLKGVGLQ